MEWDLPADAEYVRTTDEFDQDRHPAGLLRAHRVADRVWARLLVRTGGLTFTFDDRPDEPRRVPAGASVVIPPARLHHLTLDEPVTFVLEFYRQPDLDTVAPGHESTGLADP